MKLVAKKTVDIHYTIEKRWSSVFEDGYKIAWGNIITGIIEEHNHSIMSMLSEGSKTIDNKTDFDVSSILDEFTKGHPDTVLVNPIHIKYLRKNDDFYLDFDSTRNYYGKLNYLDVHWCSGVNIDEFKVYE